MFNSLLLQVDIVRALAFREQSERIRKSPLGAVGLLVEPLLLVATFLLLRIALRARGGDLMDPTLQIGSGFVLFYLFSRIAIRAINGVTKSQRFAQLRRVRPLDVLMAGALVESQVYGTCLVVVIAGVGLAQWQLTLAHPGEAVAFFTLIVITALGVGISALVIGHRVPVVKLFVKLVIQRLLFWTSGLFFATVNIPDYLRPLFLWNPLLHGIELFRHALAPTYPIPGISLPYLLAWAFGSLGFSMLVYGNNEQLLEAEEVSE